MKIQIQGEITDRPFEGCFSPDDLKDILSTMDENEPLEVELTSEGGSVFAGIQISNMLARWKGDVTIHGVGFVASIATVILMAGKRAVIDSNAFCLLHLPWTMVTGNANDLNKEIDNLDKCRKAMMGFYMRKAIVPEETINAYLENETWLLGEEMAQIFDIEVLQNDERLDIAARVDLSKYKNIPERILNMKNKAEETPVEQEVKEEIIEEVVEKQEETLTPAEEKKVEEVVEEITNEETTEKTVEEWEKEIEELKSRIAELENENAELKTKCEDGETVTKAEADARVSGMQSSM